MDPEGVFVLPPAAVQELQLKVQPWRAGSRFLYVNAVDVEHRRLVTAWLLCLSVHRPVLSKVGIVFFWLYYLKRLQGCIKKYKKHSLGVCLIQVHSQFMCTGLKFPN